MIAIVSKIDPILIELPEALIGTQVIVRPWRAGDGAALFEAVQESLEHVRPWLPWGPMHDRPETSEGLVRRWRTRWDLREDLPAGIWDRVSGQFIGGCGLHRIDWDLRSFEIGYWCRASAVGRGYITEAARLLTSLAFDTLGANRVFIRVAVENERSNAIPRRLGFIHEGTHRNALMSPQGDLRDMNVFGLVPEEWRRLNP